MTLERATASRRRFPPPRERYRALARTAGRGRTRSGGHPLLAGAIWALLFVLALSVASRAASGAAEFASSIGGGIAGLLPQSPTSPAELQINATTGQVGAAPVLTALAPYTRDPALLLQGQVPSFARAAERTVAVSLNGGPAAAVRFDAEGRFAVPLTLKDGENTIVVALKEGGSDTIASTTATLHLVRTPPSLTLSGPKDGDSVDGPNVAVSGKSGPGATVFVNDRQVVVSGDGSFSDSFTAQPGTLALTVVARDRAGNETKAQLTITVKDAPAAAATALTVVLSKATVKPGEFVTATITLTTDGRPVADANVSLQVGVVPIASARTDATGRATVSFFAPPNEGIAQVVVLGGGAVGSATLSVAR